MRGIDSSDMRKKGVKHLGRASIAMPRENQIRTIVGAQTKGDMPLSW